MTWIDELEVMMSEHLYEFHNEQEGLGQELRMFAEFLIYSKFSEGEHIAVCPFVNCAHEIKFNIEYKMYLVVY